MLDIKVPSVGESISEVVIARWNKKTGDYVAMDELLCELESDKATFELNAEKAGILTTKGNEGDTIKVGDTICLIDESAAKPEGSKAEVETIMPKTETAKPAASSQQPEANKPFPSVAAAKILAEKGIDVKNVIGTGKEGRITKGDALNAELKVTTNETKTMNALKK
jgi:2-oxoglutarate dehydrogenase E2 component (dihydrolipoamide succinyltransferase)